MTALQTSQLSDLPLLTDLVPADEWARDIIAASRTLFARGAGLLRHPDGGLVVVANDAIRALAETPAVGNAPVSYLTRRSDARLEASAQASGAAQCPVLGVEPLEHFLGNQVFTMNPPVHTTLRRGLLRPLMPKAVLAFEPLAASIARSLVDELVPMGDVDFGPEFAAVFVTRFWTQQLGLPSGHADRIQHLMEEMNLQFRFNPTPEQSKRGRTATREYMALLESLVDQAWAAGPNDLLTMLADGVHGAELNGAPADFRASVASNFFDAFHTVGVALTNAFYHLVTSPDDLAAVRADQSLVPQVFTEGTRVSPPLMLTTRMTLDDVEHAGYLIPAGTPLHMIWAAGNHDPEAFPEPDRFDLSRTVRHTTTFGGGAHMCPGRNAARLLSETAIRVLTSPDVGVEAVGSSSWVEGSGIRHLDSLRVRFSTGGAP